MLSKKYIYTLLGYTHLIQTCHLTTTHSLGGFAQNLQNSHCGMSRLGIIYAFKILKILSMTHVVRETKYTIALEVVGLRVSRCECKRCLLFVYPKLPTVVMDSYSTMQYEQLGNEF